MTILRSLLPLLLGLGLVAACLAPSATPAQDATQQPSPIERKMAGVRIPSIEFSQTPLSDALAFLQQRSVELERAATGNDAQGINILLSDREELADHPVTLRLRDIPIGHAITLAARAAGAQVRVDTFAVMVELPQPDATAPAFYSKRDQQSLREKLDTIVIPSIEFSDTPVRDAIEFLVARSMELDPARGTASSPGINIALFAGPTTDEPSVTLRLTEIPLGEAIRYTAELAGLSRAIEGNVVILAAPAPAE